MKKILMLIPFFLLLFTTITYAQTNVNVYSVKDDKYIYDIVENTTISTFMQNINADEQAGVYKSDEKQTGNTLVATGMTLKTEDNKTYYLAVKGDNSGDGKVTITDLVKMKRLVTALDTITDNIKYAADISDDNKISVTDIMKLKKQLVGMENIKIMPKDLTFENNKLIIDITDLNTKRYIEAKVIPITAAQNLTFEVSDTNIATVSLLGFITPKTNGNCTITAKTENGISKTCDLTVQTSPIRIILSVTEATIDKEKDTELQIHATIEPSTANAKTQITYTSSDENIATVDSTGKVTAISKGVVTITATTENGKTATAEITVKDDSPDFIKYTDLTDEQLLRIADVCIHEQDGPEGVAAEASQMCNRYELFNKSRKWDNLHDFVEKAQWWSCARYMGDGKGSAYLNIVKQVIVEGKRTLPGYIDEHDTLPTDLWEVSNNGVFIDKSNRSLYYKNITKIKNANGATYTFYCFPGGSRYKNDPFGYTKLAGSVKDEIGDGCYDINGNPIDGKGGSYRGPYL